MGGKIEKKKYNNKKGFALLYSIMISSILLAITIGVTTISYKEIKFGTEAKEANEAFFAADVGAECALYYDRSDVDAFNIDNPPPALLSCGGRNANVAENPDNLWKFTLSQLNSGKGCAVVTVDKQDSSKTTIIAKGYNIGGEAENICDRYDSSIERVLEVEYEIYDEPV